MFTNRIKQKISFVDSEENSFRKVKKSLLPGIGIVNGYTLIAVLYCASSAILFYYVVQNMFLAKVHFFALIAVAVNYLVLIQTKNLNRATNIILTTGTIVVISLFATGGWANTGYLWPFAYLPFAFFLSERRAINKWVAALFGGCLILVILHFMRVITIPYSPVALINYFAALLVFTLCIFLFQNATIKREEALSSTENLLEAAPDAVIVIDNEGRIVKWNQKSESLFGWTGNEVRNRLLGDIIIPHRNQTTYEKWLKHLIKTGKGQVFDKTIEIQALKKNNIEFDASLSISPATVQGQRLLIGFIRDITERKESEEKIKDNEQIFSVFFYKSPVMKAILDVSTGNYIDINDAFVNFLGRTKEEILGKTSIEINMLGSPDDRDEIINRVRKNGSVRELEMKFNTRDGGTRWLSLNVDVVNVNGRACFLSAGVDITQRKLAEERLLKLSQELETKVLERTEQIKKSEKKYRNLFENNPMPMWVFDLSTFKFLDVNEAAISHYGYSREEFLSMTALDIRPMEEQVRFKKADHSEKIYPGNNNRGFWKHLKKDGTIINVEIIGHNISFEGIPARFILSNDVTEKMKAEEKVDKSEKLFRAMIEKDADMKTLSTPEGKVFYASPSLTKILGYENQEFMSMPVFELVHPDDVFGLAEDITDIIQTSGKSIYRRQRLKHKNGTWLWCEGTITNMLHEPAVAALVSNFRDITKRKKLEEQQELLGSIVNSSDDAIISKTLDSIITSWNLGAERIFGYSQDEIIGKHISILIPPKLQYEEKEIIEKISLGMVVEHFETERIRKDGKIIDVSLTISPIKDLDGKVIGASKISRDISERKKAEESLRLAEANYREIFDKASDAIYVHDIETGQIIEVNHRASEITGFTRDELLTSNPEVFMTDNPDYTFQHAINYLQKAGTGEPQLFEWMGKNKDSSISWLEVNLKKATIAGTARILAFFREINDRKKAQFEIQELNESLERKVSDRTEQLEVVNRELEAFSYSVSHDLRAPLRAINGFANILGNEFKSMFNDEGMRLLDRIRANANKMGVLIDDLLEFSRLGRKEIHKSPVQMTELVEAVLLEINTALNHKADVKIHRLHPVNADSTMLKQVMLNLLYNAIKYSSKTGKPFIEIKSRIQENEIIYSVRDNGVGFNNKYADKLFGVFERLHLQSDFEGTGVGLALVKRIINKHGGRVWATGELNKGATFFFSLPASDGN